MSTVPRTAKPEVHAAAPALGWYSDSLLYHEVWNRPALSRRDRSVVTIAALVTRGNSAQLKSHLNRGLKHGVTPIEVIEIITHLAFLAGWPYAMTALTVAREVFEENEIQPEPPSTAVPSTIESPSITADESRPFATLLRSTIMRPLDDELWERTDLSVRDRSLIAVASIVAGGELSGLRVHAERASDNGVSLDELCETVAHLAFYVGLPTASAAATLLDDAFGQVEIKE